MGNIDLQDLYETVQELKSDIKALQTGEIAEMKDAISKIQYQIDWFDSVLEDNDICPLCGGEIIENIRFYSDNGYEKTRKCEDCHEVFE